MDAFMSDSAQLSNLRTLTITRIPTGILGGLARQEVWVQMPQLTSLSIQVIPDWRSVWMNFDLGHLKRAPPSASVSPFYRLLKDYIAPLKFIRKLSIGWVSGGENAQDLLARNEHLMPLPLEPQAGESIITAEAVEVLHLPFVEELILINGWVGPLTLVRFIKKTTCPNLREIVLDSVSLAAQFERNLRPHQDIYQLLRVPLTSQNTKDLWSPSDELFDITRSLIRAFRPGCWLDVLEAISPGETWADTRHGSHPTFFGPRYIISHSGLVKLEFRSCGYVGLPNLSGVQPNHTTINRRHGGGPMDAHRQTGLADKPGLDKVTMITGDSFLGTICRRCSYHEWRVLEHIYKLEIHGPTMKDFLDPPTAEAGATNAQINNFWSDEGEEDDKKGNDRFSGIIVKKE